MSDPDGEARESEDDRSSTHEGAEDADRPECDAVDAAARLNEAQLELTRAQLGNARRQRRFWDVFDGVARAIPKIAIWAVFFSILWLLRGFFALIFVTFVWSFLTVSGVNALARVMPKASWRARTVCVFTSSLAALGLLTALVIPQVKEGVVLLKRTVEAMPDKWVEELDPWLYENVGLYRELVTEPMVMPSLAGSSDGVDDAGGESDESDAVDAVAASGEVAASSDEGAESPGGVVRRDVWEVETVREWLLDLERTSLAALPTVITNLVTAVTAVLSLLFLSLLFGFLIVLDLQGLGAEVRRLEETRLHGFYRETARDIVRFGAVLGRVLEAQAVIAMVNALLTAGGLWLLDIPHIGFLCMGVFLCGFIPVAGVFISSAPIALVALYVGGVETLLFFLLFVTLVHFLEAYVLNPRIMGAALKINPVLVLVILVIGHHALGVWGLLLGLPICYYFFTHVIKRDPQEIGLRAKYRPKR